MVFGGGVGKLIYPDNPPLVLVFVEIRTSANLGTLSLNGDHAVEWLLEGDANLAYTDVSPDGHWIVSASDESGQPEVYVRPFPNVRDGC